MITFPGATCRNRVNGGAVGPVSVPRSATRSRTSVQSARSTSDRRRLAVMKYGEPRYTKDLDVWVHNSPQNSVRVVASLKKFGAPLDHDGITEETLRGKQVVYQIGVAPIRIDILTEITGIQFPDAWRKKVPSAFLVLLYISYPSRIS